MRTVSSQTRSHWSPTELNERLIAYRIRAGRTRTRVWSRTVTVVMTGMMLSFVLHWLAWDPTMPAWDADLRRLAEDVEDRGRMDYVQLSFVRYVNAG